MKNPALLDETGPVAGGLYFHSKTGNHYTILCLAAWRGLASPVASGIPLALWVDHWVDPRGSRFHVRPAAEETPAGSCSRISPALWCGDLETKLVPEEELVVYVGHYDHPRGNYVYVRTAREWYEIVEIPGGRLPRFVPLPE